MDPLIFAFVILPVTFTTLALCTMAGLYWFWSPWSAVLNGLFVILLLVALWVFEIIRCSGSALYIPVNDPHSEGLISFTCDHFWGYVTYVYIYITYPVLILLFSGMTWWLFR